MTVREESFKNYRSRTNEKWKAKDNKSRRVQEAKDQKKRGPALKNRLVGDAELYKGLVHLSEPPMESSILEILEASLHQRSSECVPL